MDNKKISYHDRYFRRIMSDLRVAKDFLRTYLPHYIQSKVDFDSMQICKESYVETNLRSQITDILYSVNINSYEGYFYILVEHQSKSDSLMPFRLQKYMFAIMEQHLKQTHQKVLPIIVPMVFYNGKKKYAYSTDILDLFGENKELAEKLLFKPFHLIDLNQISDEEIRKHTTINLMEFVMKHIWARDILPYIRMIASDLKNIDRIMGADYIVTTVNYLLKAGNIADTETFFEVINQELSSETGEKLMTGKEYLIQKGMQQGMQQGLQQGMEQGIQQGLQQGVQKGHRENSFQIARKLIARGYDTAEISEITGISIQEIIQLKETEDAVTN